MSNWCGDWILNSSTMGYTVLKHGSKDAEFTLTPSEDAPGVYLMKFTAGKMTSAWSNTVLLERGGVAGPTLPYSLPAAATETDVAIASDYLAPLIKAAWNQHNQRFTCLEGDFSLGGFKKGVALFKVDGALADGKAFLIVLMRDQLDRQSSPDGSAAGRQK